MVSPATEIVCRFPIIFLSVVISHKDCLVVVIFKAVGSGQDIFLVDDGTTTEQYSDQIFRLKIDWRMFKIKVNNKSVGVILEKPKK